MSINNCCCEPPPPPGITGQQACSSSETIMSQTGLITDLGCGIKPVINEIFGVQMQSTAITINTGLISLHSTAAKDTFVFGYALSGNMAEVTSVEGDEELFTAIPLSTKISPIQGTIPCYWVWWTKNRCLELDIKFPNNNFSGCIEHDVDYYKADLSYWCGAYANPTGLQGAWSHDGESCWRPSQFSPSDLTNLYTESGDGGIANGFTNYQYVDEYQGAYSIGENSGTPGIVGFGCCTGWGHSNCSPSDWQMFGVNEVGSYHNEAGESGRDYYSSYTALKLSHHNVKYPASTIEERLASIKTGGGSCYAYENQAAHVHKCWNNDQSNPREWDREYGDGPDKIGVNCKNILVNGLTPYQRRVSEERSPDIWEIHEFNDGLPVKIKVQDFSIDRPAIVKIWGDGGSVRMNNLKDEEDGIVRYTDISAGGDTLALVQQNFTSRIYDVYQGATDQIVSPTESRRTIILKGLSGVNTQDTKILQGAQMLYKHPVNGTWQVGGSYSTGSIYPYRNFIKKVSCGYNHVIATRDNYTAEVSETDIENSGDRQYYSKSIPTAIPIISGINDYGQIDVPYSPGSKRFPYDWILHNNNPSDQCPGCTSCQYPLFKTVNHTLTFEEKNNSYNSCEFSSTIPPFPTSFKLPVGSCRFARSNRKELAINCNMRYPWCATCFTAPGEPDCPDCPPGRCSNPYGPDIGVLSCQGIDRNNDWNIPSQIVSCAQTPTPLCGTGYPPLTCGTVNNWYICGTGGFNDTLHDYSDYEYSWNCGNTIVNYDKNYCEGIQSWDPISAGGYHNVAINKHSTFTINGITSCICPDPETHLYPFGSGYNAGNNVVAWGAGEANPNSWPHFGQSVVPNNMGPCKRVSAGGYHSLAIDNNNKIHAWGAGSEGMQVQCSALPAPINPVHFSQSTIPDNIKDVEFIEISAGKFHSCGIRKDNGLVMCWGAGWTAQAGGGICQVNWGQSIVGATLGKCISISAGGFHTCAIKENGIVKCWGKNTQGQCIAPDLPCIQISCGDNFSAGRFIEDEYETFPYWNSSNIRSSPALASNGQYWPISLFRYFFAFASMEFTYGRGEFPQTPGVCDVDWARHLPKAYHQRSDAVHIFAFETEIYTGNNYKLAEQLMEEDLSEYVYQGEPIQLSWGALGDGASSVEPGWRRNCDLVNTDLSSPYYWADRMSCKDWRQEIWNDLTIIKIADVFDMWPELKALRLKYDTPGKIKPVGAYRIRGDRFDIRDARDNELNTSKRPPELAKMASRDSAGSRISIPPEYKDTTDNNKYTLQVNSDIYKLTVPPEISFNREQLDAFNRLTCSVYFRPKPIGWEYSGPDFAASPDWPNENVASKTMGTRSWRYGWLHSDRRKTYPRAIADKYTTMVSTGIGSNNLIGKAVQGQPYWDTYNRGYVVTNIQGPIALTVQCDFIGPQVAYTHNAHIYAARHIPGINTKGGAITQIHQGYWYPRIYEPGSYTCSLFNIT